MKVFISGTKFIGCELPEEVCRYLDDLMTGEKDILIGDCIGADLRVQKYLNTCKYRNVTVYVSGSKRRTRFNEGRWEEKHYSVNSNSPFVQRIEKDFHMAEDADCGLAIWDGKSKGTFNNLLCLSAQKKACKVYLLDKECWVDIVSMDDLRLYVEGSDEFADEDIRLILDEVGFSEEMSDYLVSEKNISTYNIVDIVCRGPISLDKKMQLLGKLAAKRNLNYESFLTVEQCVAEDKNFKDIKRAIRKTAEYGGPRNIWSYIYDCYREILNAKEELSACSVIYWDYGSEMCDRSLYLFDEWYDIEDTMFKSSPSGLFIMPELVEEYIVNEEYENEYGEGYYRLETWNTGDLGWKEPRYDYYYDYRGNVCWFEKMMPEKQEHGNTYYFPENRRFSSGDLDLNLTTPYKTGDIVLMDCRPFGPPFHAMILEDRDQIDCCFPNIVFCVPGTEEWRLTPLKHRGFYKDISFHSYEPMLSPLYRLRKVRESEYTKSDERLLQLSRILAGDKGRAEKVWEKWRGEDLRWEEVMDIFTAAQR